MITDYQLAENLHKRHVKLLERGQRNRLEYGALFEHFYCPDREPALFRLLKPEYNDLDKKAAWQTYLEDNEISLNGKSPQWSSELASVYRLYIQQRELAQVKIQDYSLFNYAPIILKVPIYMLLKLRPYLPDTREETIEMLTDIRERCRNQIEFEVMLATELREDVSTERVPNLITTPHHVRIFQKNCSAKGDMILKAFAHLPLGTLSEIDTNSEYIVKVSFERISVALEV